MVIEVTAAEHADLPELADVAALTFPLACPAAARPEDIAAFIATTLSAARFAEYLADPTRAVLIARNESRILGYAMTVDGVPDDPDVQAAVTLRPAVELSKMYVVPDSHGGAVSAALMRAALVHATAAGAVGVWLGVNQQNRRAQRFYGKHGFAVSGTKTFRLGAGIEQDFVMLRPLLDAEQT
ncbi:GNAT family N-acetyltransferase [Mycolicibacterium komossense]|uniref:GNAT family N-acetyltransferase n=1 Tax=Mycolicibacterium komossense TaxID=1779 RepID=A0ABT3CHK1_9MYCO|nr:GNAT family N-acetyltransferase [Mycolicibacterium komossense]MCV7228934.1 GNAT family N-acetyltransferase [Mycolicibacterium komossense]